MTIQCLLVGGPIGVILALGYLVQTFGVHYTSATNCGLITGLFVVFAPIANYLVFGTRTRPMFSVAVALSVAGMALLSGGGPEPLNRGDLLTLGAALCYGLHICLLDRYARQFDAVALALAQVLSATAIFVLIWPITDPMAWPGEDVWHALVITGVLATAASFCIQTYAQQRMPAVRAAVIFSMEPVFAAVFGYWLAGDRLTAAQLAGGAVMVGALLLAEIGPRIDARGTVERVRQPE
jgi:drug/metabolite transporter (DMT)-like permease